MILPDELSLHAIGACWGAPVATLRAGHLLIALNDLEDDRAVEQLRKIVSVASHYAPLGLTGHTETRESVLWGRKCEATGAPRSGGLGPTLNTVSLEGAMTVPEIPRQGGTLEPARSAAIERQLAVERGVMRSILRDVIVALPVAIAVLIGMMALALSNKQPWYVWVGLGAGMGVYAAAFFGMIAGVMISAHRLDQVDEPDHPLHSGASC